MRRTQERLKALEEEQKRIQVFERYLPLSLELVTKEIESCRKELSGDCGGDDKDRGETMTETVGGQSDVEMQKQSHSQAQYPYLSLSLSPPQAQSQSLSPFLSQSPSQPQSLSQSLSPSPSQAHKKQRLAGTPELHNKFYSLMQQLGSSDVATPKEVRAYYLKRQQQGSPSGREN